MAKGLGRAQDELEGEITCPLCLDIYEDPKILPCGHIYCREPCLTGLARQHNNTTITCPECRGVAPVQGGDCNTFPTVYKIVSLVNLHRARKDGTDQPDSGQDTDQPDSAQDVCQTHKGQEIAIYCETCSRTLCRDCLICTAYHKEHKYEYIKDIVPKYREKLRKQLDRKQGLGASLDQAMTTLEDTKAAISNQQTIIDKDIDTEIDRLAEKLKANLHSQLTSATTHKLRKLQRQYDELSQAYSDLLGSTHTVENALGNLPDTQFALKMRQMEEQLKQATMRAEAVNLSPVVAGNISFHADRQVPIIKQFHLSSGKVADPSKCTYKSEDIRNTEIDQEIKIHIDVCDSEGWSCTEEQSVSVELHYVCDFAHSQLDVQCVEPGRYLVQFTPKNRGRYTLAIKVNGAHIVGSPTSMFVKIPPQKLGAPVATITGMKRPGGLICQNGKVLACEYNGNRIVEIDKKYEVVKEVTAAVRGHANELVSDSESNIYVTTGEDCQLHKIDRNWRHLKATGTRGTGKDQFDYANGIEILNNKLYVCDTENHRIKVYDLELNLIEIIGKKGLKLGQFLSPLDLAFDTNGEMYVVDRTNRRIQVLSPERKPIREIGKNQLNNPISIFILNSFVFVTECNKNCVSVFTTTGAFVTTFGQGYLVHPEGITIDEDGFVYVTSHYEQIMVF